MKAAIFSPGLQVGGMEKMAVLAALALRDDGWTVELLTDRSVPARRLERAFGTPLGGVRVRELGRSPGCGRKLVPITADCDLFINNSSSDSFPSFARKSWLWVHYLPRRNPKFLNQYRVFANSRHTRNWIRTLWKTDAGVLHGPVSTGALRPLRKEKMILSAGRLRSGYIDKNERHLIRLFARLHRAGRLPGWTYHIAGAMNRPDREWMKELERCAAGAPVKIHLNPPFPVLRALYGRASLFWNGTGAHRNPDAHPKDMEHFGAAIVEAMAAGCVPLAFAGGGPREIIADGKTGFLYRDWDELAKKTASAAASTRLRAMAKRARASAARFSEKRFRAELKRLLAS